MNGLREQRQPEETVAQVQWLSVASKQRGPVWAVRRKETVLSAPHAAVTVASFG